LERQESLQKGSRCPLDLNGTLGLSRQQHGTDITIVLVAINGKPGTTTCPASDHLKPQLTRYLNTSHSRSAMPQRNVHHDGYHI